MSVRAYAHRMERGKIFLHEAPDAASSWEEPGIKWLASQEGVYRVKGPMCRWEMTQSDKDGPGYIRKETGWLTNSRELAELLQGTFESRSEQ